MYRAEPDAYAALTARAALFARPELHTLSVTGPDRVRFLNGQLTNDVARLAPGQGCLAVKVNRQGRIEAVVAVRATDDALELDAIAPVAERLRETLDRYLVMDDAAIVDRTALRRVLAIAGPEAARVLAALDLPAPEAPHGAIARGAVTVVHDLGLGFSTYALHAPVAEADALAARAVAAGATLVSRAAVDVLRVERGWPLDGADLDLETFPMEAGLDAALSYTKGCYVGQEVIARAKHLGHMNYRLVGLAFPAGSEPSPGANLWRGDKRVGEVRSVALSVRLGRPIALGYLRAEVPIGAEVDAREAAESSPHGPAALVAEVRALPFG